MVAAGVVASAAGASIGVVTEYTPPTAFSADFGIVTGPDGNLWFTEEGASKIGRSTPSGAITEYPIPAPGGLPTTITVGPNGNLWFAELTGEIGEITTAGVITQYAVPTSGSQIWGIATGSDGNLWFSEISANQIGRITPAGVVTEYPLPNPNSDPAGLALGPDGNMWFVENTGNQIGEITPAGVITEYPIPTPNSGPANIALGPDGNLWFTEANANQIGEITPAGVITEYPIPTPGSYPIGITSGPNGNLWFTEAYASQVGQITTGGLISEYPVPTSNSEPVGITTGPDDNLWFAELTGNNIGVVTSGAVSGPRPDHFRVTVATTTETTGTSFPVTVTAIDASNHTVTGYAGPVTLTDTSGSLSASAITWSGGVGSATVSVGTAISRDRVTATDTSFAVPPTGTSTNVFAVTSTKLDHFHFSALPTTWSTGAQVQFSITALDAGSQVITSFAGPVTLTDTTGTLDVASVVWTNGVGLATVSVGAASTRDRITAVSGNVTDVTGVFNVLGPVASLRVSVTPVTGNGFVAGTVTVTAVDSAGQVVTGFAGPVTLTDTAGGMLVYLPGSWVGGVETVGAAFLTPSARDRVMASDGNGHSGVSAVFVVGVSTGGPLGNVGGV